MQTPSCQYRYYNFGGLHKRSVKNMCILNKLYCYISSRGRLCDPVFRLILSDTAVKSVCRQAHSSHKVAPCDTLGLPFPLKQTELRPVDLDRLSAHVLALSLSDLDALTHIVQHSPKLWTVFSKLRSILCAHRNLLGEDAVYLITAHDRRSDLVQTVVLLSPDAPWKHGYILFCS